MKPVKQTVFGAPLGNCFAACVASLLEMSIDEMPSLETGHFTTIWNDWFRQRGIGMADVKAGSGAYFPGYCIASGKSPRGGLTPSGRPIIHAVICKDMNLVYDPHPDGGFLDGTPTEYTLLYPLNPVDLPIKLSSEREELEAKISFLRAANQDLNNAILQKNKVPHRFQGIDSI